MQPHRHHVLGYPLHAVTLHEAASWVLERARPVKANDGRAHLVVTLNPEIVVQAESDLRLASA